MHLQRPVLLLWYLAVRPRGVAPGVTPGYPTQTPPACSQYFTASCQDHKTGRTHGTCHGSQAPWLDTPADCPCAWDCPGRALVVPALQEKQKPNLFKSSADSVRKLCADSCNSCVSGCKSDKKVSETCKGGDKLSEGGLGACLKEYNDAKDKDAVMKKYA